MPDAIDAARRVLKDRLTEIEGEAAKLRSALTSLGGAPAKAAAAPKRKRRKRGAKRAPRGQRRQEFLAAVKKSPGATAAELGRQLGISTNQAYALAARLAKAGEVKKSGKGYKLT